MRTRKCLGIAAPLALMTLVVSGCGGTSGNGAARGATAQAPGGAAPVVDARVGGDLTFGADQEPTGFNENTDKDNGTSTRNIMEAVLPNTAIGQPDLSYKFNRDLLAADPTVVSTSPEVIEYKIRPEAKWSDGVDINVDDFVFDWQSQNGRDPRFKGYASPSNTGYGDVTSVEAVNGDKKDVRVTYARPFGDWQSIFSANGLLPAHYLKALAAAKFGGDIGRAWYDGLDTSMPISGGPFKLQSYKQGDSAVLVRNDAYYGPKAKLDRIIFRFLPESTTQPQALQSGEVGVIYPQPQLDLVNQVKSFPRVSSQTSTGASYEHIDFNLMRPGLDDINVRRAIALGVNRPALISKTIKQFSDQAQPLGNRIWLNNQKHYVDHSAGYGNGDSAAANKALDDAGYVRGRDGIRVKGRVRLSFKFTTTAGNGLRVTTFNLFQAQMKPLGIDIQQDIRPSKVIFPDLTAHKFDLALFAWVGTPFPVSSNKSLYSSDASGLPAGQNYGYINDPKVNRLFDQAGAELDPGKSAALGNEIDQALWDGMYTIPLFQKPTFIAYDSKYVNIHDNSTSDGPSYNAGTWGLTK